MFMGVLMCKFVGLILQLQIGKLLQNKFLLALERLFRQSDPHPFGCGLFICLQYPFFPEIQGFEYGNIQ